MTLGDMALQRLHNAFDKSRIVFWEDADGEFADDITTYEPADGEVVIVDHNEFAVKRRVLLDEPRGKFLVYRAGGAPERSVDFLLDIKLASANFSNSRAAEWAQECGMPLEHEKVLDAHAALANDVATKTRLTTLFSGSNWLNDNVNDSDVELALLAAACGVDTAPHRVDARRKVALAIVKGYALGDRQAWSAIELGGLEGILWRELRSGFGYASDEPGVSDFYLTCHRTRAIGGLSRS